MAYSLADIAREVDGTLVGDATVAITGAAVLADAGPGDVTLVDTADKAARLGVVAPPRPSSRAESLATSWRRSKSTTSTPLSAI